MFEHWNKTFVHLEAQHSYRSLVWDYWFGTHETFSNKDIHFTCCDYLKTIDICFPITNFTITKIEVKKNGICIEKTAITAFMFEIDWIIVSILLTTWEPIAGDLICCRYKCNSLEGWLQWGQVHWNPPLIHLPMNLSIVFAAQGLHWNILWMPILRLSRCIS